MKNEFKPFHIRMLEEELKRRKKENHRYSLRAFARFLGVGSSSLSRILIGSQEMTFSSTTLILQKLKCNEEDRILFLASIAEDKRRRAFELLTKDLSNDKKSETYLNSISTDWLLSKSPDLIFVVNKKNQCLYVNEAGAHLHNKEPQELIGKTMRDVGTPQEVVDRFEAFTNKAFLENKILELEDKYQVDDKVQWFHRIYVPIIGKSNEVVAVSCHLRNITARKELEFQLSFLSQAGKILSSSYDYKKTLRMVVDLMISKLADGCFIHINIENNIKVLKVAHKDIKKQNLLKNIFTEFPYDPDHPHFYHNVLRDGKIQFIPNIDELEINNFARNENHLSALKELNVGSYICVPMKAIEKIIGSLTMIRSKGNIPFSEADLTLVEELSSRAAWAIDCTIRIVKDSH